jgi:hypothetical protein
MVFFCGGDVSSDTTGINNELMLTVDEIVFEDRRLTVRAIRTSGSNGDDLRTTAQGNRALIHWLIAR